MMLQLDMMLKRILPADGHLLLLNALVEAVKVFTGDCDQ